MSEKADGLPTIPIPQIRPSSVHFDNLTADREKSISLLILNRSKDLKMNTGLFQEPKYKFPSLLGLRGWGPDWPPRVCHICWY